MKPNNQVDDFGEIINAINSPEIDIDGVLRLIMENVSHLINANDWSLLLVDEKRKELVFKEVRGEKSKELTGKRMPMNEGVVGWVIENKEPVTVEDPYKDERFFKDIDRDTGFKTKNILAVPLMSKNKILGVIEAINKEDENFTQNDLKAVNNYANHAAIAIENANLVSKLQNKIQYLTLLSKINRNITSILDLEELIKESAELIQKTFNYFYVAIGLLDGDKIVLKGFSSGEDVEPEFNIISKNKGLIGKSYREKKRVIVFDTSKENEYLQGIREVKSEMIIPIMKENKYLGVIDIGSKYKNTFNEEEADILEEVSHQLTIALDNAKLYKKLKEASITDELTGLYNARFCNEKLPEIISRWINNKKTGALIFIDLDYFKKVNDSYNHLVGSKLLHLVAERIRKTLDEDKIGIRYGGDEYVVAVKEVNLKESIDYTLKLKEIISSSSYKVNKNIKYDINASFGIARFPKTSKEPHELLRLADLAMYYVKTHGRDNIAYVDEEGNMNLIDE